MDARQHAAALLRALGSGLGLELVLDGEGACGLRVDDHLTITLRLETGGVPSLLLHAVVAPLPDQGREAVLRRALEANHLWEASRGATWSLAGDELVLCRLLPLAGLEADALGHALACFIDVAREEQTRPAEVAVAAFGGLPPPGMFPA